MGKNLEQRVEELEKLVKELRGKAAVKISKKLGVGDTFELNGLKWKILDITEKGYMCLADRLEENMQFDLSCNDWEESKLRKFLNTDIYNKIADEIGAENIIPFERDLLSLDGQTEYGSCEDKVSLLTVDEYRKYRKLIPNTGYFWWTITPDSTKCNDDAKWVRVVSPSGNFYGSLCYDFNGVRPLCILESNIFVSRGASKWQRMN